MKTSVILVAGGKGTRMKASTPKQFLLFNGKPIARYSFDVFCCSPKVDEIIVVCDPQYEILFQSDKKPISFALPGALRQDSVFNGLQKVSTGTSHICVHDAARPFINLEMIERTFASSWEHGAAVVAISVKSTIKKSNESCFVLETLNRDTLWEIQTPQVIRKDLLEQGFAKAQQEKLIVTDDVSLVELLKHPVKLVEGSYNNIKITTPEDLLLAQLYLNQNA